MLIIFSNTVQRFLFSPQPRPDILGWILLEVPPRVGETLIASATSVCRREFLQRVELGNRFTRGTFDYLLILPYNRCGFVIYQDELNMKTFFRI